MAMTKEERLQKVHARAIKQFNGIYGAQQEIRLQCLQDRRFVSVPGAQWEGGLQRQFANRPRFEVNKVHMAVMRIFNEYRANRITVDFRPKDGAADSDTADTLDGLYRADEQESNAQEAYDNAFDEAVSGGIGAWRLRACYEDDEDDDDDSQRIRIEPIYDADSSVFFDLNAKRQDKADATCCFVISSLSRYDYESEYVKEGESIATFGYVMHLTEFDWYTPDVVYIAEYYEVEEKRETITFFVLPTTGEEVKVSQADLTDDKRSALKAQGFIEARKKNVKRKKVHKYLIDGARVMEDCGIIAGNCIPIVPMFGKRAFVDNVERVMGAARLAIDSQKLYNMEVSMLAEIAALSPIQKPILTPEQIQGHSANWAADNIERFPYLLINNQTDANGNLIPTGQLNYTQPPMVPQSLASLIQLANADMAEVTGNQQGADQVMSNTSAQAVQLTQNRLDMQSFIYQDNMAKAMRRSGVIWLAMAKDLYDQNKEMRTVSEGGGESMVEINQPKMEDGKQIVANDIANGKYDVIVDVGPSFTSKRDATVKALTGMLQYIQDPQDGNVILSMAAQNLDGEGLTDLKAYFRKKLVTQGIVKPTDDEAQQIKEAQANQQPDANTQYLQAAAANEVAKSKQAEANTVKALADAEKSRADTANILAKTDSEKLQQIMTMLEKITSGSTAAQAEQAAGAVTPQPAPQQTMQ